MLFQSSKLKARTPLLPRLREMRALTFERAFENVTQRGIGCTFYDHPNRKSHEQNLLDAQFLFSSPFSLPPYRLNPAAG